MAKLLKVVSIIMIVLAIIAIVVEAIAVAGFSFVAAYSVDMEEIVAVGILIAAAVILIIASVLMLVAGILGNRSQKTGKYLPCIVLGIIIFALSLVSIISSAVGGSFQPMALVDLILPVLYLIPAFILNKK